MYKGPVLGVAKGPFRGRARTVFVLLGGYPQLARIAAYSDGLIQYGVGIHVGAIEQGYDFGSFVSNVHRGTISAQPGNRGVSFLFEERLSGLGSCVVDEFRPLVASDDLIDWTRTTIDELNPCGADLLDFGGVEFEEGDHRHPGIRQHRTVAAGSAQWVKYDEAGREIRGRPYRVVIREDGGWSITDCAIFADGTAQLGPMGALVNFRDVVALARAGRVTSSVPDGQWVNIDGLGIFRVQSGEWWISQEGLIVEAEDILVMLQGKEGCVAFCLSALRYHLKNTSPASLDVLKEAYDWVPAHMREPGLGEHEHEIRRQLGLPSVNHIGRG
jgi:hypothetical protein